jgi:hypothetical protein
MRSIGAVFVFILLCGTAAIAADVQPAQQNLASATAAATPTNPVPAPASSSPPATTAASVASVSAVAEPSQAAPAITAQAAASRDGASSSQVAANTESAASTFKPPPGFRAVKRGSTTVYCTTIKPIGSNIPQTSCLNQEQVKELESEADVLRRQIVQKSATCVGQNCLSN